MKTIKRGKLTYYIGDESIIIDIGGSQWISYNVYSLQNRKPFYDLKKELINSNDDEYNTVIEQIKLGQRFGLKAVSTSRPRWVKE